MGLFVDIPKPRAWPPPHKDSERVQELFAFASKRDPIGDKFHILFACAFFFTVPISTLLSSIAGVSLIAYWVIRLSSTYRTLTLLIPNKLVWCLVIWFTWLAISLSWSSDISNGLEHLRSARMMFLPILLWPIITHWKKFIVSALLGVVVLNILQISDLFRALYQNDNLSRTAGMLLGGHPPNAGLWCAFSITVLVSWIIKIPKKHKLLLCLLITAIVLSFVGCVLASGRGNFVGLFLALLTLVALFLLNKFYVKKMALVLLSMVAIIVSVWSIPVFRNMIEKRTQMALTGYENYFVNDDPRSSTAVRLVWWSSAHRAFRHHPFIGLGLGGFPNWTTVDKNLEKYESRWPRWSKNQLLRVSQPHSVYFSTISEGGLIGIGILVTVMLSLSYYSFCLGSLPIFGPILLPLVVLWFSAGTFDSFQYHGQTLAVLGLVASISILKGGNFISNERLDE